ncbi:uroporphyrinogen-III synthase, partial [Caulobacter sp. S45]|uniref:uroporphyrinogen-III synthase n=1 Tax=Caulobacter sp. S45 TaxID=1641861 RepID=UPI0015768B32
LQALGRSPLVASLLEVRPLPPPSDLPSGVVALAFTSANAVLAFARHTPQRDWPVFAVGEATAEGARAAGFRKVSSADGDVASLARRIAAAPPDGCVLHPCAEEAAGDLTGALIPAGVRVESLPLYQTCPVERLPTCACAALERGVIEAALLHSPKGARTLAALWAAAGQPDLACVRLLGLSAACLIPLAHLPFRHADAAAEPNEASLLELL